jgi:hypothetical protein
MSPPPPPPPAPLSTVWWCALTGREIKLQPEAVDGFEWICTQEVLNADLEPVSRVRAKGRMFRVRVVLHVGLDPMSSKPLP